MCCNEKTRQTAAEKHLHGHIVVCVLAYEQSPRLCLVNILMPLRASNLLPGDLRPVVFVGQGQLLPPRMGHTRQLPRSLHSRRMIISKERGKSYILS